MRRGNRRTVTEISGAIGVEPGERSRFGEGIFEKAGGSHAGGAAARAVAVAAAIGVGRAILVGVGFLATVAGGGAVLVACRGGGFFPV